VPKVDPVHVYPDVPAHVPSGLTRSPDVDGAVEDGGGCTCVDEVDATGANVELGGGITTDDDELGTTAADDDLGGGITKDDDTTPLHEPNCGLHPLPQ